MYVSIVASSGKYGSDVKLESFETPVRLQLSYRTNTVSWKIRSTFYLNFVLSFFVLEHGIDIRLFLSSSHSEVALNISQKLFVFSPVSVPLSKLRGTFVKFGAFAKKKNNGKVGIIRMARITTSLRRKRKRKEKNEEKGRNEREKGRGERSTHGMLMRPVAFLVFCRDVLAQTLQQILRVESPASHDPQPAIFRSILDPHENTSDLKIRENGDT